MNYRYKFILEYDGNYFPAGWQRQKQLKSAQETFEAAIKKATEESITCQAAGRTDAGVHALHQVVHIDLSCSYPISRLLNATNAALKNEQLVVKQVEFVNDNFQARFSSNIKTYIYKIHNTQIKSVFNRNYAYYIGGVLNFNAMKEALEALIVSADFSSFRDSQCQAKKTFRSIENAILDKVNDVHIFSFQAKSFLHHQVRIIMGTILEIGRIFAGGKKYHIGNKKDFVVTNMSPKEIIEYILLQKDRNYAGITAPAYALYLANVEYEKL